jgi:IS30 family transposase
LYRDLCDEASRKKIMAKALGVSESAVSRELSRNTGLRGYRPRQRRKRRNSRDMRGTIENRVGIAERPEIVERKIRIGDWEGDTVVGKKNNERFI